MPVSPPLPDPAHIEARMLVVADMLEHAVAEVRRAIAEIRTGPGAVDPDPADPDGE
jgi:hypothetical protein